MEAKRLQVSIPKGTKSHIKTVSEKVKKEFMDEFKKEISKINHREFFESGHRLLFNHDPNTPPIGTCEVDGDKIIYKFDPNIEERLKKGLAIELQRRIESERKKQRQVSRVKTLKANCIRRYERGLYQKPNQK